MKWFLINKLMCSSPLFDALATTVAKWVIRTSSPVLRKIEEILKIQYPLCTDKDFLDVFTGKRIAVVGNGPIGEWKWPEIDSHDVVIRFNFWVLPAHLESQNTWTKTSVASIGAIQTIASKTVSEAVKNSVDAVMFNVAAPWSRNRPSFAINRFLIRWRYGNWQAIIWLVPNDLWAQLEHELEWHPASTGYATIAFLLRYTHFKELSIYGFTFSSNNRIVGTMWNVVHDFDKEREILLSEIEKKWNVNFHWIEQN